MNFLGIFREIPLRFILLKLNLFTLAVPLASTPVYQAAKELH